MVILFMKMKEAGQKKIAKNHFLYGFPFLRGNNKVFSKCHTLRFYFLKSIGILIIVFVFMNKKWDSESLFKLNSLAHSSAKLLNFQLSRLALLSNFIT